MNGTLIVIGLDSADSVLLDAWVDRGLLLHDPLLRVFRAVDRAGRG